MRAPPPSGFALFSCVDLFCGCGGNSWGMLRKNGSRPLLPLLAVDIDPVALWTYHWNMPKVKALQADIQTIAPLDILNRVGLKQGELGCLIASPPCQTYSRNNRSPKEKTDHRNTLYAHVLKMIAGIQPWIVFMENVPEMETCFGGEFHQDFLNRLRNLGYSPSYWTVNTASYGVPQHRQRLIYLAYRTDMGKTPRCPPKTHGEEPELLPWVTVEQAIQDLPPRQAGELRNAVEFSERERVNRSPYALSLWPRRSLVTLNHFARSLNSTQLRRLRALGEGGDYDSLPADLRPAQGYKASYGRLWRGKPAPTLTAYLSYPGCGRFSHYEQDRVITIREALRLQSFDDDFWVFGPLMSQSNQVGNAVPPLLATAFRDVIVADLRSLDRQSPQ